MAWHFCKFWYSQNGIRQWGAYLLMFFSGYITNLLNCEMNSQLSWVIKSHNIPEITPWRSRKDEIVSIRICWRFLPRDAMQARPMSSCGVWRLSVCVSVTFVHSVKFSPQPGRLVLDLSTPVKMKGWVGLVGWLHTEMVYPSTDGHPSEY